LSLGGGGCSVYRPGRITPTGRNPAPGGRSVSNWMESSDDLLFLIIEPKINLNV